MAEVLGDDIHIDTCFPSSGSVLVELTRLAPETVTKQGNWPKRANILSGKLRSITPILGVGQHRSIMMHEEIKFVIQAADAA